MQVSAATFAVTVLTIARFPQVASCTRARHNSRKMH